MAASFEPSVKNMAKHISNALEMAQKLLFTYLSISAKRKIDENNKESDMAITG